jgi:hypothetical protein
MEITVFFGTFNAAEIFWTLPHIWPALGIGGDKGLGQGGDQEPNAPSLMIF